MLATLGPLPRGPGWGWEWKWDGVRAVAYVDRAGTLRLMSRNDRDVSGSYPDLAGLGDLGAPAVLDGEIVALDERGAPSFERLQSRMHVVRPTAALLHAVPVRYYAFDVMWLDGRDLSAQPYTARRAALDGLPFAEPVEVPPMMTGVDVDPEDLLTAAAENGLEGVMAKRLTSPYRSGRRSPDWVKVPLARTQEVIVVGWKAGEGRRAGMIGALLLAAHDDRADLRYVGSVGTGFTEAMLRQLEQRLGPLERDTAPLSGPVPRQDVRGARWVEPVIVAEVQFRNWTADGRLRHPSFRGLRPDKEPGEVRRVR